ncbi:MAG: hypothetical protein ACFE8F_04940 [Promethearchaeota archaeon]
MFSLKSGHGLKVLGIFHALIGAVLLLVVFFTNPIALTGSGIPYGSFELFLLSWWLWRFPGIVAFREQMLLLHQRRAAMTTEDSEQYLHRAWRFQLLFVILWGWICTILFGALAHWLVFSVSYAWSSVLLLGEIIVAILGWIMGSALIVHRVFSN